MATAGLGFEPVETAYSSNFVCFHKPRLTGLHEIGIRHKKIQQV